MGLLAEVYTSELGALYMEDPSWFAWHNSTVPTEERERWYLVWEQAHSLHLGVMETQARKAEK